MKNDKKSNMKEKLKDKIPFSVFVSTKFQNEDILDYKQILTEIISNRIQENFR